MQNEKDISVVIPIYNEQETIPELYQRLTASLSSMTNAYELIFVNDGSKDRSLEVLMDIAENDDKVFYINFSRNFGHQIALSAGLEFSKAKCTVLMDGDLQDPPELIPKLYDKYQEGYEVVYAKRQSRDGETWLKKTTAKIIF